MKYFTTYYSFGIILLFHYYHCFLFVLFLMSSFELIASIETITPIKPSTSRIRLLCITDTYILDHFPRVKTAVDQERKLANQSNDPYQVYLLHNGDFVAPSFLSSIDEGLGMIRVMSQMGFDYIAIGNHESDIPFSTLEHHLHILHQSGTKLLVSNTQFNSKTIQDSILPYDIIYLNHQPIGLIGLLTNDEKDYALGRFNNSLIESPLEAAQTIIKQKHPEIKHWIGLTHVDWSTDRLLAESKLFDLIIGGHNHEGGLISVANTPIVKAGMDAEQLVIIDLIWDETQQTIKSTIEFKDILQYEIDLTLQSLVTEVSNVVSELVRYISMKYS